MLADFEGSKQDPTCRVITGEVMATLASSSSKIAPRRSLVVVEVSQTTPARSPRRISCRVRQEERFAQKGVSADTCTRTRPQRQRASVGCFCTAMLTSLPSGGSGTNVTTKMELFSGKGAFVKYPTGSSVGQTQG